MVELINHFNTIHPLSPEAIAALIKVIKAKELSRGQVWLQEGAVCDKISFVIKGLLKLYFEPGNKELILHLGKENEFVLSAQSYFTDLPSEYAIRAVEPSVIVYISKMDWKYLIQKFSELNIHFLSIAQTYISSFEQHSSLLMLSPKERFDKLTEEGSWLGDGRRITDRLLAGYIGVGANAICNWRKPIA